MLNTVSDPKKWHSLRKTLNGTIGFVPTMGNLHAGHLALVERAMAENDICLVSIFVNPTQFNDASDYEAYARTIEEDCTKLEELGVQYVFIPDEKAMYPDAYELQVSENKLAKVLEGEFRPGHFDGMLTVVLKLLNIAVADKAYFGEKDFQQLRLVQKMVQAFFLPTEIVPCATLREENGLAMSSRNNRLTAAEKDKASLLYRLLCDCTLSDDDVMARLTKEGFKPEYITQKWGRRLAAAWLGDVRLIDNIAFEEEQKEKDMQHAAVS